MKRFRLYFDKDAEQDWIKEMCLKGWALEGFFLGVYTFIPCKPGEYIYQIDLLDNWRGDKEDFATFMEDSGVEVVAQWYRWVFLRKKASDGPFEMYTDSASKIEQYKRVKNFFLVGFILEAICFLVQINGLLQDRDPLLWFFVVLLGLICLTFLRMVWKCQWKIEQLKRDN